MTVRTLLVVAILALCLVPPTSGVEVFTHKESYDPGDNVVINVTNTSRHITIQVVNATGNTILLTDKEVETGNASAKFKLPTWGSTGLFKVHVANEDGTASKQFSVGVEVPDKPDGPKDDDDEEDSFSWRGVFLFLQMLVLILIICACVIGTVWGIESTRWKLLLMSSATRGRDATSYNVRLEVHTEITTNPGVSLTEIRKVTGIEHKTLVHYLAKLGRQGHIRIVKDGTRIRFFPIGVKVFRIINIRKVEPGQVRLLRVLEKYPGATQRQIAELTGYTDRTVRRTLEKWINKGKVAEVEGREWRYILIDDPK